MEIVTVFNLRAIGIAQFFVNALLFRQGFIIGHVHRDVMGAARAEGPAAARFVGLVQQRDGPSRTTASNLKTMKIALNPGFAETQSVDEEALGFGHFADGKHAAVKALGADVFGNSTHFPGVALIGVVFDDLDLQAARMAEPQVFLAKAFLGPLVGRLAVLQVTFPKAYGALGNRVRRRGELA